MIARLKIAQIAPLIESVPPQLYGGTERVVSYLTEELVDLGHDVTLFASGDSITRASLVPCCPLGLRLDTNAPDPITYYLLMLNRLRAVSRFFDILHFHIDQLHFPLFASIAARTVTSMHDRQDMPNKQLLYSNFPEMPLIAITNAQRTPVKNANILGTIHHGIPVDLHPLVAKSSGGYLAFLGRIAPEKRLDRAIAIAQATGMPLKIAAKVDRADRDYFNETIKPLLGRPGIEFIGEIDERQKSEFLGHAAALLFPIDWPEPFGLVMIESMACGTPVLAFRAGSASEIVENGLTGFVVDTLEEAIAAVPDVLALDRRIVRQRFEQRFSARRMALDYVSLYRDVITRNHAAARIKPAIHDLSMIAPGTAATLKQNGAQKQ